MRVEGRLSALWVSRREIPLRKDVWAMKSLFSPAIALMNHLKYPSKFGLIGLLFAVPLGLVTFFFVSERNDRIAFGAKEGHGNEYLRPVQQLTADLRDHRGLTWSQFPDRDQQLKKIEERLVEDVQAVDMVDRKYG